MKRRLFNDLRNLYEMIEDEELNNICENVVISGGWDHSYMQDTMH